MNEAAQICQCERMLNYYAMRPHCPRCGSSYVNAVQKCTGYAAATENGNLPYEITYSTYLELKDMGYNDKEVFEVRGFRCRACEERFNALTPCKAQKSLRSRSNKRVIVDALTKLENVNVSRKTLTEFIMKKHGRKFAYDEADKAGKDNKLNEMWDRRLAEYLGDQGASSSIVKDNANGDDYTSPFDNEVDAIQRRLEQK